MTHKAIFENLLLTEEAKAQLEEAFTSAIEAKTLVLEAEYREKEEAVQESVLDTVKDLVAEALSEELDALSEELEHARTLDVQYAEKLETFKESYAAAQDDYIKVLVAESVQEEVGELREDVEFAKKNAFGMKIYEAYQDMFAANFGGADIDVAEKLREAELQLESYHRKETIETLLEGIGGKERSVFTTLLEGTALDKLEARFESVKAIVMRESVESDTVEPIVESAPATNQTIVAEGVKPTELAAAFNKALGLAKRKTL